MSKVKVAEGKTNPKIPIPHTLKMEEHALPPESSPRTLELFNQVFENDLLRELILDFVIHDGKKMSPGNSKSCRLVRSSWFESVNKCLASGGEPLFKFKIDDLILTLNPPLHLSGYLDTCDAIFHWTNRTTPFSLKVAFDENRFQEKIPALISCLRSCARDQVRLTMEFPPDVEYRKDDGDVFEFIDAEQALSLPMLKMLSVVILRHRKNVEAKIRNGAIIGQRITPAVQFILSGCANLTSLVLRGHTQVPRATKSLKLPSTVTKLVISDCGDTFYLEMLLQNTNLNLTQLSLDYPMGLKNGNVLFEQILNMFRHTLKKLDIFAAMVAGEDEDPEFTLPVMTRLKSFHFNTDDCRLTNTNLSECLPVVRRLDLDGVPVVTVVNWAKTGNFESVEEFKGNFIQCIVDCEDDDEITLELSQCLIESFSNVTNLSLAFYTQDNPNNAGVQNIFKKMTQLRVLSLKSETCSEESQHYLDALLMGMSVEMVKSLESLRTMWEVIDIRREKLSSIASLSDLRELKLEFEYLAGSTRICPLSDVVFQYAFLKMPKLQKLKYSNLLIALSSEPVQQWQQQGGKLEGDEDN